MRILGTHVLEVFFIDEDSLGFYVGCQYISVYSPLGIGQAAYIPLIVRQYGGEQPFVLLGIAFQRGVIIVCFVRQAPLLDQNAVYIRDADVLDADLVQLGVLYHVLG